MPVATIRAAGPQDAETVFALIRELAEYERLSHEVDATEGMIADALGGPNPRVFADLLEVQAEDANLGTEVAGFALWFYSFSTFRGRHGIWLEDLYVRPHRRGHGYGKRLLAHLARRCVTEDLARLEWSVLDWNDTAIGFYKEQGAVLMDGWTTCRLTDAPLWRLADVAR